MLSQRICSEEEAKTYYTISYWDERLHQANVTCILFGNVSCIMLLVTGNIFHPGVIAAYCKTLLLSSWLIANKHFPVSEQGTNSTYQLLLYIISFIHLKLKSSEIFVKSLSSFYFYNFYNMCTSKILHGYTAPAKLHREIFE